MRHLFAFPLVLVAVFFLGCADDASTDIADKPAPSDAAQSPDADAGAKENGAQENGAKENGGEPDAANKSDKTSPGPAVVADGKTAITPENTTIGFKGTKADGAHVGGFKQFSGEFAVNAESGAIEKITVEIQTDSLWSDNEKLTAHLKNSDFFHVKQHPTAKFESTAVEVGEGEQTVTGNLTLLGVTKEIQFPATVAVKDGKLTLASQFTFDRTQFGMSYGQGKVDNDVQVQVAVGADASGK